MPSAMLLQILRVAVLIAWVPCVVKSSESDPLVTAPAGTFQGKRLTSFSGTEYAAFRGIPYALPPVGKRRFAKPEPFPKIKGILNATDFGPICVQRARLEGGGQEDCLYLNVYTPLRDESTPQSDSALKKVFVFIHGGGFIMGSSKSYLPGDFVTRADVVVVTMNYRLGLLGFMRGNADSLPGNQGFWDQLLALQWVKDNIRAFGGDPDDVTVGGESAGGMSSLILSIARPAKDLYTKTFIMSTAVLLSPSRLSLDLVKLAARETKCHLDPDNENIEEFISCLQELPAEELAINIDMRTIFLMSSSGDELLPRPTAELLHDMKYLSEVGFFSRNYTLSLTREEGSVFLNSIFAELDIQTTSSLARDIAERMEIPEVVAYLAVNEYLKLYGDLEKTAIAFFTDGILINHGILIMEMFEKGPQDSKSLKNNIHLLSFDHSPTYMPHSFMFHALDLAYIFDLVPGKFLENFYFVETTGDFTDEDWKLKYDYIDLVKRFMSTGTPDENLARELDGARPYISFSLQPSIGQDILGDRRRIWYELFPKWMKEHQIKEEEPKQEL